MKRILTLLACLVLSCQNVPSQIIPSADVPEADRRPLQILTTALRITVRDNLGNTVDSAQVQIFKTKDDYEQETNPVGGVQYTDRKGRIRYTGIEAQAYYINVEKGDMNNYGAGTMTEELSPKRSNNLTIIIE